MDTLSCSGLMLRHTEKQIPASSLVLAGCCSVALAPGWHLRPGCKWCCCSGRCSLSYFLPWLCYSYRRLGLHPVYAVHNIKCTPKPYCSLLCWRQMVGAAQSRAGCMAGCVCDTKVLVIQMLLADHSTPQHAAGQQLLCSVCVS